VYFDETRSGFLSDIAPITFGPAKPMAGGFLSTSKIQGA
jgi:hypothetical protein